MRNDLNTLLNDNLNDRLIGLIISRPREKTNPVKKLKARPVMIKEKLMFQVTSYKGTQVLHENVTKEVLKERVIKLMERDYVQIGLDSDCVSATGLVNRKGEITLKVKNVNKDDKKASGSCSGKDTVTSLMHNRKKRYILEEGIPVDFLIDLGLMTKEGKVVAGGYDKFRQINRFLEYIDDVADGLAKDREVKVLDFGCGKSYLTFAMYHYLNVIKGLDVRITGLDLKEDVIRRCNSLKDKYGYDKLNFMCGDVADFDERSAVDLMVTLHACDTATDYALYNAVVRDAGVILSVPCCQHEVNKQIDSALLHPVMKYGIIKERMSALITDGVRAELLRACGYDVQLLEFIDMEHTPKNILIRAVRKDRGKNTETVPGENTKIPYTALSDEIRNMLAEMKIKPVLYRLLVDEEK